MSFETISLQHISNAWAVPARLVVAKFDSSAPNHAQYMVLLRPVTFKLSRLLPGAPLQHYCQPLRAVAAKGP